jgi:hypothetical protein
MILNNYIQAQEMTTTDHFDLHNVLNKMMLMDKISQEEMDNLLTKSGLTKLETGVYEDANGSVLAMASLKQ